MTSTSRSIYVVFFLANYLAVSAPTAAFADEIKQGEESHPGMDAEAKYAEAVLAYNGKKYDEAVQILDSLLNVTPNHIEALELKALTLKTSGKDLKSFEVYKKLLTIKPPKERAPYEFEIGSIFFREKKYSQAKPYLLHALAQNFNPLASHFYLGFIGFQTKDFEAAAEHFAKVVALAPKGDELSVASHYYLGLIDFRDGYGAGATHELIAARDEAALIPESGTAKEISSAASQALSPYNKGQWFGNIALLTQYDSNVSLLSTGNTTPDNVSGKSTLKESLAAGIGRMTSPLDTYQLVGSYRGTYNHNFNTAAQSYEFATNTASFYMTYAPLARTNYGLKVEGSWVFQHNVPTTGGSGNFQSYNKGAEIGPYLHRELAHRLEGTLEVFFRPQKFDTDPSAGDDRRSGHSLYFRAATNYNSQNRYWNPEASLAYEPYSAQGINYNSKTISLDLNNTFKISSADHLSLGASYSHSGYNDRIVPRSDGTLTLRTSFIRTMNTKWSFLADAFYTKNGSNIDEFTYNKFATSLGLSYSL